MRRLARDVRLGLRVLRRQPVTACAAVAVLAVGLGANAAVYELASRVFVRPLPIGEPDRVVAVLYGTTTGLFRTHAYQDFLHYRRHSRVLTELAASIASDVVIDLDGRAENVSAAFVSPGYFSLLRVTPMAGASLLLAEPTSDRGPTMAMSHAFWRRVGGDATTVGRTVQVNGQPVTVVGVTPADFAGLGPDDRADIWLPLAAFGDVLDLPAARRRALFSGRSNESFHIIGRLHPAAAVEEAQDEIRRLHRGVNGGARRFWAGEQSDVRVLPVESAQVLPPERGRLVDFVSILALGSLLALVAACLNGTGVMLLRLLDRSREVATRLAVGATRRDVSRQLMAEAATVTVLGAAIGLVLAVWFTRWFTSTAIVAMLRIEPWFGLRVDTIVYVLGGSLVLGVLIGGLPALYATQSDIATALRDARAGGAMVPRHRWGQSLCDLFLAAQVAISAVLLVTATVLFAGLHRALSVDVGVANRNTYLAALELAPAPGARGATPLAVYSDLIDRVQRLPGVRSAALAATIPFGQRRMMRHVQLFPAGESRSVECTAVSPGYFSTMGVRIVRGRPIGERDGERSPPVAVINEAFATRYWPNDIPIGKTFRIPSGATAALELEIVGVARTGKYHDVGEAPRPFFFMAAAQHGFPRNMHLAVQPAPGAGDLHAALQREVYRSLEPIRITDLGTMAAHLNAPFSRQQVAMTLVVVAGLIALAVTLVGLGSATAYAVTRRRAEIGVRMSLGATPAAVVWMFLSARLRSIVSGLVLGCIMLLVMRPVLSALVLDTRLDDPAVVVPVAMAIAIVAAVACAVPARAAARIRPMDALRSE